MSPRWTPAVFFAAENTEDFVRLRNPPLVPFKGIDAATRMLYAASDNAPVKGQ